MTFLNTTRSNTLKSFPKWIILPLRGWEFQNTEKLYMPSSADDMLPPVVINCGFLNAVNFN